MSKGLGKVERAVLGVFEADPSKTLDSISITIRVHGQEVTDSQYSSTRRALNSLQKGGFITRLEGSFRFGRSVYALPKAAEEYVKWEAEFFGVQRSR